MINREHAVPKTPSTSMPYQGRMPGTLRVNMQDPKTKGKHTGPGLGLGY